MFKKLKDKKGFTLVELIVVLVILAILAALLVPALTGYIDKANKEKVVAETRMVAMAVQTEASEAYGAAGAGKTLNDTAADTKWEDDTTSTTDHIDNIKALAEVVDLTNTTFEATITKDGKVSEVKYNSGAYTCTYNATNKTYETVDSKDKLANTVTISK
jgi:type IV pilus assembly protein PilA